MELTELEAALDELRPEDKDVAWGLKLVMTMLGNVSEGLMHMENIDQNIDKAVEQSGKSEEEIDEALSLAKTDMIGALFVAVGELAHEQGVDLDEAVELRLDRMRTEKRKKEMVQSWAEAGLVDEKSGQVDTELSGEDDWAFM